MNCPDVKHLLHPYSDGELDLVRNVEIEAHLSGCADCAEQEKRLRSLRGAISSSSLYHRAPAALRTKVRQAPSPATRAARRPSVRQFAIAASILLLVGISATLGAFLSRLSTDEDRLAERVVAGHVRSLQVEHLMDVASSDRHTVKPWFRGKIDFSPHVPDLSSRGYALKGGRLDYLADRPVVALVYQRRLHAINLFTWPADNLEEKPVRGLSRQGFHMRTWQRAGMTYWAISDLNDDEFDEFVRRFQEHAPESRP